MPSNPGLPTPLSETALEERIALQDRQIMDALAPYEPRAALDSWFETLRAIEEFVNLVTVDWDDEPFSQRLFAFPIVELETRPAELKEIHTRIIGRFGEPFGNRFVQMLIRGAAIARAFALNGVARLTSAFRTVGAMIGYLQSRRRHFVGLLHLLPLACRGRQSLEPLHTFNDFLPIVELSAVQMMGAHYQLIVKLARDRLRLPQMDSAELAMLDPLFLEPERAPITQMPMTDEGRRILDSMEPIHRDRLFSAAELRNDILLSEAAYAEFDLRASDFAVASELVRRLSREHVKDDFWVAIPTGVLQKALNEVGAPPALRSALVGPSGGYMACLSTYAPFVHADDQYLSTVTLLSRFIYAWRARSLDRRKRFQIRSGFIFEDAVANELRLQGFAIQDIVRINRREFDVVALRDSVIWNVQCKNNFVDLSSIDADARRFARYNQSLVMSYERALSKERGREHLLKNRLALDAIQHVVVSRFPVVSDNPRIVPFSRIAGFAKRADALISNID